MEIIGNHAFLGTALETLVLPTGVKSIGAEALAYNPTLNSVTIRSGLTDIGADLCKNSPNVTIWTDSAAAPIYAYAVPPVRPDPLAVRCLFLLSRTAL